MTPHALFRKELRAVLPWFGVAVLSLGCAGAALQPGYRMYLAQPAFFLALAFGCAGLPAQAWGHDYSFGTLASLTAQPIERRTLMVVKIATVAPLVAAIALGGRWLLVAQIGRTDVPDAELFMVGVLCMITVAPLVTMLSRSVLGGTIFTIGIAGFLLVPADAVASAYYHFAPVAEVDALKWRLFWGEVVAVSVICGAFSWRTFMRLEALDGGGTAIDVPWAAVLGERCDTPARRGLPHRALTQAIAKELRLQQIGFVLTGLFGSLWLAIAMLQRARSSSATPLDQLALLYFGLTALVVGASASAEERQLGVLQSQLLLPRPAWWVWGVKAAVTLSVALLLGVGVPMLVTTLGGPRALTVHGWIRTATQVVFVTSVGVFASSFSRSTPRALVVALALAWTNGVFFDRGIQEIAWRAWQHHHVGSLSESTLVGAYAACSAAWIVSGYGNHRSLEHGARRIALQIAGCVAAEAGVLGVLAVFAR